MPFIEHDPWRTQFFDGIPCPRGVVIPTDDGDCWLLYPRLRHLHNKLYIANSQGLEAAPHGVAPPHYPVFSKPIYNLKGMGKGSRIVRSAAELRRHQAPGHMWTRLLVGEHVSSDVALARGKPVWWRHTKGKPGRGGTFDHWTVEAARRPKLEAYCGSWLRREMAGFSGVVNLETIDGRIIEIHLRMSDQWPDLYGQGWVESLVPLYRDGLWDFADRDRRTGYSVVLFGPHGRRYRPIDRDLVAEVAARPGISSIQISFHDDRPAEAHSMPPGGFRLAIVNCASLAAGRAVRARLARAFKALATVPRAARRR